MIKSHSEIRSKLFDDVNNSIAETTYRCIFSRELYKGYVWDVSEVAARDMTLEENMNHEKTKQRIISRKTEYQNIKIIN